MSRGIRSFKALADRKRKLYAKLLAMSARDADGAGVWRIKDARMFEKVISTFGANLDAGKAEHGLETVYEAGIHKKTGALVICNKGATLFSYSPKRRTPHLVRHIGFCLYVPGLGVEFVNVGLVGDIYGGPTVLRSESACTPSFLFGSERCNCAHQWETARELAAAFNRTDPPPITCGRKFEAWVRERVVYRDGRHVPKRRGTGFILMHLDTQNGMGSGYTEGHFAFDLYSRASLRHRGEYSSEQVHGTTMAGGFRAIGLEPDPRKENDMAGYKVTFIVLDYLGAAKDLVFLSNNPLKMRCLEKNGYRITRLSLMGEINVAGAQEARERGEGFEHLDICGKPVSFEEEFEKLKGMIGGMRAPGRALPESVPGRNPGDNGAKKYKIAVFGSADAGLGGEILGQAFAAGKIIGRRGHTLITGAAAGVSAAAARGAKTENGRVVGISPTANYREKDEYNVSFEDIDEVVHTGAGYKGRNVISVETCDAMIVINGRFGTLNEASIGEGAGKPVVAIKSSGGCAGMLEHVFEKLNPRYGYFRAVDSPEEAVLACEEMIEKRI